ncbi:twin-arginine translocase TatA/TatE family subunit [Leifsonia sp. NPDC014704]|uniref:twin-arginine translocase TatA/TatE family subunit n=1 Tax=Leifsonia sp. NPDC014704 TaxID=3364123 RepID=UPI0036F46633
METKELPMLGNLTGWHALIILAVVLLIFGAAKLPALARSVGQSVRILQKEVHKEKPDTGAAPVTPAATDSASSHAGNA